MFGSCALIVWRHKMQPIAKSHADFDLGFRLVDFSCRAGVHGYPPLCKRKVLVRPCSVVSGRCGALVFLLWGLLCWKGCGVPVGGVPEMPGRFFL